MAAVASPWGEHAPAFGYAYASYGREGADRAGSAGLADLATDREFTLRTRVNCGSVAKFVTAYLVARIWSKRAERERLRIGDLLPGIPGPLGDATIEACLTHTTGLWDFRSLVPLFGERSSFTYGVSDALGIAVRQQELVPGFERQYSNTNYLLLGVAVEREIGRGLADLVTDWLGADVGNFVGNPRVVVPGRARGYEISGTGAVLEFGSFVDGRGSTNFWANGSELATLVARITDGYSSRPQYGGLPLTGGRFYVAGHDGGFQAAAVVDPDAGRCHIALTNDPSALPAEMLATHLGVRIGGAGRGDPTVKPTAAGPAGPVGTFACASLDVLLSIATNEAGALVVSVADRVLGRLEQERSGSFSDGHLDVVERDGQIFLSINHARGIPLVRVGERRRTVQTLDDSTMSMKLEPLPSALRELGVELLRGHRQTIDRDRLLSVCIELMATLPRTGRGALVELGCYKGAMAAWMRAVLDFCRSGRQIHVFDSFEGLPAPADIDGDHLKEGDVKASPRDVLDLHERLGLTAPAVHPGWFDDTLGELPAEIAFAYIDADFYGSTSEALRAVLPRLVRGGTVILDDYADLAENPRAWAEMAGVKRAWDDVTGGRLELDVILGFGDLAFGVHRS